MKRLIGISCLLILLLASCGNNSSSSSSISSISSVEESTPASSSGVEKIYYTNPVYDFDFADPSIIKGEDGYFYAFATGRKAIRSKDLVNWEQIGNALEKNPTWGTSGANVWAPHVTKIGDEYIYYYSLSKWDDPNPGIGYATSLAASGPYVDHGKLFKSDEIGVNNSIDPFVFVDNEKVYMVWGSFRGIYLTELSSDGKSVKDLSKKTLLAGFETEQALNVYTYEAAYVVKKDDFYYLFLSQGTCCTGDRTYNVRVARASKLEGPYYDDANRNMFGIDRGASVVQRSGHFIATGHNSVIQDDAGDYWMLYHAYPAGITNKRVLLIDKLEWNDGWPSIKNKLPSNSRREVPYIIINN